MIMTPDDMISMYRNERAEAKLGQQLFAIPRKNEDMIDSQVFYYYVGDRRRVAVNFKNEICFHLNYLRVKSATPEQYLRMQESTTPMEDLLEADLIYPFLLFIDGYFIPWENITIICSQERYDLLVHRLPEDFFDRINGSDGVIKSAHVLDMPDGIEYYQGGYEINDRTMFAFDEKGQLVPTAPGMTAYIVINDMEDYVDQQDFINPDRIFRFSDDHMHKYFPENFITFMNGRYDPGYEFEILATTARIYMTSSQNSIIRPMSDEDPGPTDKVDMNPDNQLLVRVFHNRKLCTPTYDNIRKVNLDVVQRDVEKTLAGVPNIPTYMQYLKESFDPKMDIEKEYLENRSAFLDYLARYDSMLFNRVYHSTKEVIDLEVDYLWVISHVDESGMLKIPRRFQDGINYFIIVMHNGELYEGYRNHYYKFGNFFCPITGIQEDDVVELLYFKHAKNFEISTKISEDSDFLPLDKWIYGDDLRIFCKETTDEYFDFPADGDQVFPVPFHLEYGDQHRRTLRIRFEDDFYYNRPVTLVSRKRFKYFLFNITVDSVDAEYAKYFTVDFGDTFQYCNEYDRYMVFYNGKRLDNDLYRIILPYRSTTPFTKAMIYLCIPIRNGDRLEVFYLPNYFMDIYAGAYADSIIDEFDLIFNGSRHRFRNIGSTAIRKKMLESLNDPTIPFPDFDAIMEDGNRAHFTYVGQDYSDKTIDLRLNMTIMDQTIPILYKGVDTEWYTQRYDLNENGTIQIEKNKLQFALDSELCSVWVNCKKLPPSYIRNINATTLQIVHDLTSMHDVRVTAMIGREELHQELAMRFLDIDSLWDRACEAHGDPLTLMGIEKPNITDTDPESFPEMIPVAAIMQEIIRDWYVANALVDTTKPFIYDYLDVDSSIVIGKDSGGNKMLAVMDSNRTDNLDVNRPWP